MSIKEDKMKILACYTGPHEVHKKFGESMGAASFKIKRRAAKEQFPLIKGTNLLMSALAIPTGYDVILTEACYYYPALKKRIRMLGNSKIVNLNCGPTIYHLLTKRIKGIERLVLSELLKEVDGHLVLGKYGVEVLKRMDIQKPTRTVYPFISKSMHDGLLKVTSDLESKKITMIATNDIVYKGVDIALAAFKKVLEEHKEAELSIIGNIEPKNIEKLGSMENVKFLGRVDSVADVFEQSSLYIQPSRGDTFPVASLEAMAAGLPTIVSEETGTKEVVEKVRKDLVVPTDPDLLAEKIIEYFEMKDSERLALGQEFRKASEPFNQDTQLENFKKQFCDIVDEISRKD